MMYRDLYEMNEENDTLHKKITEVEIAESEMNAFLHCLDKELREGADLLIGKLARAYEMQGFLFGGTVAGGAWGQRTRPFTHQKYGDITYKGSVKAPVYQIDKKTNQIIAEYESASAAARAVGGDNSAIVKVCKGKIPSCFGYLWRYADA